MYYMYFLKKKVLIIQHKLLTKWHPIPLANPLFHPLLLQVKAWQPGYLCSSHNPSNSKLQGIMMHMSTEQKGGYVYATIKVGLD